MLQTRIQVAGILLAVMQVFVLGCGDAAKVGPATASSDPSRALKKVAVSHAPTGDTAADTRSEALTSTARIEPAIADGEADGEPSATGEAAVQRRAEPLRIAFISYANPQTVARDIVPIVKYLEPVVGGPVRGFVTLDYGSAIESMRNKQTDLAFVDPLAFMMAHEQIGAEPLLLEIYSSGVPKYHSCIWVRKDSGIKNLEDLRGKTIAFADQIDMSGHLLPRDIFERKGLLPDNQPERFFKQAYFAGGDEQAIRAVLNEFVDAAGVSQYANLLLRLQERDEVTTLATSIESPSHLLMARKGLSKAVTGRIKKALLSLDAEVARDKAILDRLYGVQGYAEAELSDFSAVAQLAARYGFVKRPQLFAPKPKTQDGIGDDSH